MRRWLHVVLVLGCGVGATAGCGRSDDTRAAVQAVGEDDGGGGGGGDAASPAGEPIDPARELMITDLSVVEDTARTTGSGAWTFAHLIDEMSRGSERRQFVLDWLMRWETDQVVNGFTVPARPAIRALVIDPWLVRSGCAAGARRCDLDLTQAPLRLLAIVHRPDLRNIPPPGSTDEMDAGEGRLVFGVLRPDGTPLQFTVIFEYALIAPTARDVAEWARAWHALGARPFGPGYNAALEALTERFARHSAAPHRANGSGLNQLRTNEIALARPWELREFRIDDGTRLLRQDPVAQTPAVSLNGSAALASFVNTNEAAVLGGTHRVPLAFLGAPFRGGAAPAPAAWNAPGVTNLDARQAFAVATCNGCHTAETGARFVHVAPRAAGVETRLSGFLTGTTVEDPVTSGPRTFNDLARRADDFRQLLASSEADIIASGSTRPGRGAGRAH
jgi:hypothetical protein